MKIPFTFKNLRMRTQIIIVNLAFLILFLLLVVCCVFVEATIFNMIASDSSKIVLDELDQQQIKISAYYVSRQVAYKHKRGKKIIYSGISSLEHLASFIQFYAENSGQIQLQQPIEPALTMQSYQSWEYYKCFQQFRYQAHGIDQISSLPLNDSKISLLIHSLGLLQSFAQAIDNDILYSHQIVDLSEFQLDIIYPIGVFIKNYTFAQRLWYLNHIQSVQSNPDQQYFFSPVYQGVVTNSDYQFSITYSLFNELNEFFAVSKLTFNTSDPSYQFVSLNVLLVNNQGQVLYYGLEGLQNKTIETQIQIDDENITGFNMSDWIAIQEHATQKNSQNSILEIYSKIYHTYVHVQSRKFVKENFTLILFTRISSLQDLEVEFTRISQDTLFWQSLSCATILGVGMLFLIISLIVIYYICKPLVLLIHYLSRHILSIGNNTNNQLFKLFEQKNKKKNLLATLNDKFKNISELILSNQTRKSQLCRIIEQMKYNSKESTCNCEFIRGAILNTENYNKDIYIKFTQKLIKKGLSTNEN